MQDKLQFDLAAGEHQKEVGLAVAQYERKDLLKDAKVIAHILAARHGEVTADDVVEHMLSLGLPAGDLGNATGGLFRSKDFYFTGEWRKSRRVSNHARMNRVWALRVKQ